MSWGFQFTGKVGSITPRVEELVHSGDAAEQQMFILAKAAVVATLSSIDDSKVVAVTASGTAIAASIFAKRTGALSIAISEIPNFVE